MLDGVGHEAAHEIVRRPHPQSGQRPQQDRRLLHQWEPWDWEYSLQEANRRPESQNILYILKLSNIWRPRQVRQLPSQ